MCHQPWVLICEVLAENTAGQQVGMMERSDAYSLSLAEIKQAEQDC